MQLVGDSMWYLHTGDNSAEDMALQQDLIANFGTDESPVAAGVDMYELADESPVAAVFDMYQWADEMGQ